MQDDDVTRGKIVTFEVRVTRVCIHPDIAMDGHANRVDRAPQLAVEVGD